MNLFPEQPRTAVYTQFPFTSQAEPATQSSRWGFGLNRIPRQRNAE